MKESVKALWARTEIFQWPEDYLVVSLPHETLAEAWSLVSAAPDRFSAIVVERDEVSLTVERDLWNTHGQAIPFQAVEGPFRVFTLMLDLDLGTVGYLAPAAARLADAGIPILPQCAFLKDHLLVRASDAERAGDVLENLARECRAGED